MKKVLVLCTGNSCRSQMVEGFLRDLGIYVESAGIETHGLNAYAVKVMKEKNIDISNHISKNVSTLMHQNFDILITVCDHAKETCPSIPAIKTKIHHSFIDPAKSIGSKDEKLAVYREVRDEIWFFCLDFFNKYFTSKEIF